MKTTTDQRQLALVPEILADQGTGHYTFEIDDEAKQRIWNALGGKGAQPRAEVCPGIVPTRGSGEAAHDAAGDAGGRVDLKSEAKVFLISALERKEDRLARFCMAVIRLIVERGNH